MRLDSPKAGVFLKGWKQALSLKSMKLKDQRAGSDASVSADSNASMTDIHVTSTYHSSSMDNLRSNVGSKSIPSSNRSFIARREQNVSRSRLAAADEGNSRGSPSLMSGKEIVLSGSKKSIGEAVASPTTDTFARLEYMTSYGGKMTFAIEADETFIGRKDDNDVVLTDPKISKRHATILKKEGM